MLGELPSRAILFVLGVVYPGYLTYKTLEHDRKRPDACRGWCCYWVVYAAWATCERGLDRAFDGRVGLYRESKVRARDAEARDAGWRTLGTIVY